MEKKSIWIIIVSIALLSVSFASGAQQALIQGYLSDGTICNEDSTTVYYSVYPFDSTLTYNVQLISGGSVIKTLQSGTTTYAISRTVTISSSDTNVGSYIVRINAEEGDLWDRKDLTLSVSQCTPTCTPHAYTACYGSGDNTDRYWYNSCNQREDLAQDCGDSGYTGNNFCSNNDVYRPYTNKGCSNNACYSTNQNILQQDCGEDTYSNNFCSNNDVYRTFTDKGCNAGVCFANNQNQIVQDCGEDSYSSNFCSNNDVYRTFTDKGCTNNACFSVNTSQTIQDCGENVFSFDTDNGINETVKGTCTQGTNNGCEGTSCFSTTGDGQGTDVCINNEILKEYYTHPFTLNQFNCENTQINCSDYDSATADTNSNTCSWTDYGCGDGKCASSNSNLVNCDTFDNSTHDYFVSEYSCQMNCVGKECCDYDITIICFDNDNDNYYAINPQCPQGNDCNDQNPNIHPNANEICNGIDDNCNNQIDEDLTRTCGISNTGICQFGTETCEYGEWEDCDATFPTTEICINGLDDNCNGQTDENCQICVDNDNDNYYAISDSCDEGNDCNDQNPNIHPNANEICNGIDDNCNGQIDENLARQCGISNVGICTFGTETCEYGEWEDCDATFPTTEICINGLDDNCNGQTDECLQNFSVEIIANPTSGETILNVNFDAIPNGSFGEVSYYWNIIGGPTFTLKSFEYSFLDNGTYPVYLTATDQLGRVAYDSTTIFVSGPNQGPRKVRDNDWIYVREVTVDNVDFKDGQYLQITFSLENIGDHNLQNVHAILSIPEIGAHIGTDFGEIKKDRRETKTVILYLPVKPYDQYHFLRISVDADSGTLKRTVYQEIDFKNP